MAADRVLVTGAFGLVGPAVVASLAAEGRQVIASDLDIPAHRKRAGQLASQPSGQIRWADLTSPSEVVAVIETVAPTAIIHLAAIISPFCYARRELAFAVNVTATASLVRPPRSCRSRRVSCRHPAARSPYRRFPGANADPMRVIHRRFADSKPESAESAAPHP